jgi:hypothetical protein
MKDPVNIFVAESPLQVINCTEAAFCAKDKKNILIIKLEDFEENVENNLQIKIVIQLFSWDSIIEYPSFSEKKRIERWMSEIRFIKKIKEIYPNVNKLFIGEFRAIWMQSIRSITKPKETYLVDDGAITLTIQDLFLSKRDYSPSYFKLLQGSNFLNKVKLFIKTIFFWQVLFPRMNSKPIHLFTSFKIIPANGQKVIKNKFSHLKEISSKLININKDEVFYFGSKYSEAGILSLEEELEFLSRVINFFKNKKIKFTYVTHRSDSEKKITLLSSENNVIATRLGVPAELYFLTANNRPAFIAGAYTTSLNNLPYLCSFDKVYVFILPFHLIPSRLKGEIFRSYKNLIAQGVEVVDLYNQKIF